MKRFLSLSRSRWIVVLAALSLGLSCAAPAHRHAAGSARAEAVAEIPPRARGLVNPVPPTQESIDSGKRLFSSMCVDCHGGNGSGKGSLARELGLALPDLRRTTEQARRTDGELFYVVTHGHGSMPGQGDRWSDELKWDLVNFIRTLQRGPR